MESFLNHCNRQDMPYQSKVTLFQQQELVSIDFDTTSFGKNKQQR